MTSEVFVFLIIFVSGTVAQGDANTTNHDSPYDLFIDILMGKYPGWRHNKFFTSDSYQWDTYYDHIVASSLERLQITKQQISIDVSIKEPQLYNFEMPAEGKIVFDALSSYSGWWYRRSKIKRLENGDIDLWTGFNYDNISGIGNFSGVNSRKEIKNYFFEFHGSLSEVEVHFIMTKDPSRKRVSFEFIEPPNYNYTLKDINITLLLQQQTSIAFNRIFNDLYNVIYERVVLTPRKEDPSFEKILDNLINKLSRDVRPGKYRSSNRYDDYSNATKTVIGRLNFTLYGAKSLTRISSVKVKNVTDEDLDLQATIMIGNVSCNAIIDGNALNIKYNESFIFTSPPVVVEALFYIPRNGSHHYSSFYFVTKPNYTIQLQKEDFRSGFEKVLEHHTHRMYGMIVDGFLNATHKEVFPKHKD